MSGTSRPRFSSGPEGLKDEEKNFYENDDEPTIMDGLKKKWGHIGLGSGGLLAGGAVITGGIAALLIVVSLIMYASYNNQEVSLRSQAKAQQTAAKIQLDTTWQILQDQVGVVDMQKDAFIKIYQPLMEARTADESKQLLMKFTTEAQLPALDQSTFTKLMNSIEVQRTLFANEQKKLADIGREHETLLNKFPSSLFVGSRPPLDITIVTTTATDKAYQTGKDDRKLFPDKK